MSKIDPNLISPESDIDKEYSAALAQVTDLTTLRELLDKYEFVAWDALEVAETMTEVDFANFLEFRKRQTEPNLVLSEEDTRFLPLLVPVPMLTVSLVAVEYKVPWGVAYLQMLRAEMLKIFGCRVMPVKHI